jgi:hypothetical protein
LEVAVKEQIKCKNCQAIMEFQLDSDHGREARECLWCGKCGALLMRESTGQVNKYRDEWSFPLISPENEKPQQDTAVPEDEVAGCLELLAVTILGEMKTMTKSDLIQLLDSLVSAKAIEAVRDCLTKKG